MTRSDGKDLNLQDFVHKVAEIFGELRSQREPALLRGRMPDGRRGLS